MVLNDWVGAPIITNTILRVPYYTYSIMGPENLFKLLRPFFARMALCSGISSHIFHTGNLHTVLAEPIAVEAGYLDEPRLEVF